jgi:hypothetical protein
VGTWLASKPSAAVSVTMAPNASGGTNGVAEPVRTALNDTRVLSEIAAPSPMPKGR